MVADEVVRDLRAVHLRQTRAADLQLRLRVRCCVGAALVVLQAVFGEGFLVPQLFAGQVHLQVEVWVAVHALVKRDYLFFELVVEGVVGRVGLAVRGCDFFDHRSLFHS